MACYLDDANGNEKNDCSQKRKRQPVEVERIAKITIEQQMQCSRHSAENAGQTGDGTARGMEGDPTSRHHGVNNTQNKECDRRAENKD